MDTDKEQLTDEDIKERLRAASDWGDPWDGWQHVIQQLRAGRLYFQVRGQGFPARSEKGRKLKGLYHKCGFLKPRSPHPCASVSIRG